MHWQSQWHTTLIFAFGNPLVLIFHTLPSIDTFNLPRSLTQLDSEQFASRRNQRGGGPAPATLARWLEALASLHRHPASDREFFANAAKLIVDPIGLDGGVVLLHDDNDWKVVASQLPLAELDVAIDSTVLDAVLANPTTQFHAVDDSFGDDPKSSAAVVSPILDEQQCVVGALYGFRALHDGNSRRGVRYLEAQLVDLIAKSVAAGLGRIDREATAAKRRSALSQRLSSQVVRQVELDQQLLSAHECKVTVLFADLRGFTTLCEQLDTRRTYEMLNDVMDCLTAAVLAEQGTIIDYYGDGLAAMWNAPTTQFDHASRAARAALAMVASIPVVSRRWQSELHSELQLGVGIHTGLAVVGNIGSTQHLKYGPRGATVNVASRIEAATKSLGVPILLSTATKQSLDHSYSTVRLCQARLKGIAEAIDLYTFVENEAVEAADNYTTALRHYENSQLVDARRQLEAADFATLAGPAEFLAQQIEQDGGRKLGRRAGDCAVPSAVVEV